MKESHKEKLIKIIKNREENRTHCESGLHKWIPENIEQVKGRGKICSLCRKTRSEKAHKKSKEMGLDYIKNRNLLHFYGITLEHYNKMLFEQDYKCKICGRGAGEFKKGLFIDHCHDTDIIRGLLCMNCNSGLGQFKDNIEILQKALDYIKENS